MRPVVALSHLLYAIVFVQVLLGDYAVRFDANLLAGVQLPVGLSVFGVALLTLLTVWRGFPGQTRLRSSAALALGIVVVQGLLGFAAFSNLAAGFVHLALAFIVFGLGMSIAIRVRLPPPIPTA
jgi:heme A synthase